MTARWQKTSEAVKTISAEKVSIQNRDIAITKVVSTIKIFLTQKTFLLSETNLDPCIF